MAEERSPPIVTLILQDLAGRDRTYVTSVSTHLAS